MARVRFSPAAATRKLQKQVTKATNNPALQGEIGTFLIERIKFNARRGKPLNDSGGFPKLEDSTIKSRRNNKQRKHQAFSPTKSNLTITGQLQEAITFKRIGGGIFELFIDKTRRNEGGKSNNRQISDFLEKIGFTLFSAKGLRRDRKITGRVKQILLRFLRKELKS